MSRMISVAHVPKVERPLPHARAWALAIHHSRLDTHDASIIVLVGAGMVRERETMCMRLSAGRIGISCRGPDFCRFRCVCGVCSF